MGTPEAALARLRLQRDAFDAMLAGRSAEQVDAAGPGGSWSARDVVAHLARYHGVFRARMGRLRAEEAPQFDRYRAEDDPEWPGWRARPLGTLLAAIAAERAALQDELSTWTAADWDRTAVHPALGTLDARLWLEFFLAHEGHHLYGVLQRLPRREGP